MSVVVRCAAARALHLHRRRLTSPLSLVVRSSSSSSSPLSLYHRLLASPFSSSASIFAFAGAVGGAAAAFTFALAESSAVVSAEEAAKTAELLYASDPLVREKKTVDRLFLVYTESYIVLDYALRRKRGRWTERTKG